MTMTRSQVLALTGSLFVLILHSIPRAVLEPIPGSEHVLGGEVIDKFIHIGMFALLGYLWARAVPYRPKTIIAAGIVYGVLLEIYQGALIRGRTGNPEDVAADIVGIIVGVAVVAWLRQRSSSSA